MTKHHEIAARNFSKKTLRALAKKRLFIAYSQFMPGVGGSYIANDATTGYMMSDGRILTFLEVLAAAA